jgi:hypothetical protein
MKAKLIAALRIFFGLFYLANGLNFFFQFYKIPIPHNEVAGALMGGFVRSGMFNLVKFAEVMGGVLVITNQFVPLVLVVMFPITVIIAYIDVLILVWEDGGLINGGFLFVMHAALLFLYLPYYRPMLARHGIPRGAAT